MPASRSRKIKPEFARVGLRAGDFTFLVVTDRDDLDTQIYKTYDGCGIVNNQADRCRAASGENLLKLLPSNKPYIFTMIQKKPLMLSR
ncbi:MAG: hypothetical protein ACR2HG_10655 [Pyrinomonadaceae bacterium]